MSDKQKSPAKSEVSTPGTKKKVYVLTPDTLKKLGISSKLPSLQSLSIDDKKHTPIKTQEVSKDDITKINITLKVPENKPKIIIKKIEILRPADKLPIINRNQATYSTKKTKPIRLELPLRKNREAVEYETPEYQTMQILSDIKLSGKTESSQQNSCSDVDDKSTRSLIEDKFIEPYEFKDVSTESDITLPEINTSDSYTIENQFFYTPYKSINYENYDRHMFDYINNPVYYLDIPRSREVTEEVENDFNLNTHDDDTNYNLTEYLEEEGINLDKALEAIEKRDTRFCFGCYKCDLDLECSKISIYDIATIEDPFTMLGLELARYKRICEQITTALDKLDKFCPVDKEEDLSDDELCASSETSSVISTTENSSIEDEESAVSSSSSAEEIIGIASDKENSVIPEEAEKQDQIDNSSIEDDVTSTDSLESTESFSSADETTSVTSNTENSGNELSTEDENLSEDEATDSSLESMYKATLPFLPKKNHYELYLMEKKLILDDVSSKDQSLLQEEEMNLPSGPEDTDKNLQTGSDAEANSFTKEAIEDHSFEDIEDDNLEKRDTKKSKKKVLSTPHIKTGIRKFAKYRRNRRKPKFQHDCAEVDTDEILESVIKNNIIVNDYISMLSSQATNKNESIQVEDNENQLNDVKTSSFTSTTSTETANSGSENEANSPTKEVIKDLTQKQDQIDNSSIEDDVASTDSLESTESFSSADETTSVASNTKNIENDHREEIKKIKKLLSFVHEQIKILKKRSKLRRIQKRLLKNWLVEDIDIVLKPVIEIELTAIDFKSISSSQAKNEDKSKDDENQQDDLLIDQNTNDIKLEQVLKHYRDGLLQTGWLVEDIDLGSLQATNEDDEKQENDNSSLKKYRSLQNGWIVEDINIIQESVDDYKSISSPQATNEDESIRATVSQNQQTDEEQSDFTPNTLSRATSSELLMSLEIENRLLRFEAEMNSSTEEVIEDQSFEDNLVVSSSESVYRKSSGKSSSSEDVSAIPLSQLVTNKLFETENKLKSDDESIQSTVSKNQQTDEEQSDFTPNTLSRATSSELLMSLEIENRLLRSEAEMNSSTEEVIEDQSFEDNLVVSSSESVYRKSSGESSSSEDVSAIPLSQLDTNRLFEKENKLKSDDESIQSTVSKNQQTDEEQSDFTPNSLSRATSSKLLMSLEIENRLLRSEADMNSSTEEVIEDQSFEDNLVESSSVSLYRKSSGKSSSSEDVSATPLSQLVTNKLFETENKLKSDDKSIQSTVSKNQKTDEEQSDFTPNSLSRATSSELLMSLEIENRLLRSEAEMNSSTEEVIEDQSFEDNLIVSSSESVYRKSSGESSSSEDVSAIPLSQLVTNKLFETENKLKSDDESIQSTVSQNQQTDEEQSDFTPNTMSRATSSEQLLSLEIENRLLRSESEMNSSTEEVIEDQSFEDNLVESSSESSYRNSTGKSSNSEDVWATPLSQLDTNASEKQNVEENLSEDENISMSSIAATIEDQPFLEEKETNLPTEPSVTEINLAEESKLISSLQVTNEDESMQEEDDENFQNDDENSDFTPDTLTKSTSIEQSMLVKDKNLQSGSEAEAKSSTEDVIEDQSYEDIDENNMEDSDTKKRKQKNLSRPCIKRGIKKFVRYRRNRRKPELKSTQKLSLIEQKANDHSEDSNGLASTLNKSFSVKEDKSQEKDCFLEDIDVILEPMTENNLIVDDCISISSSSQDTNEDESIQLENDMNHKEPIASTSKKSLLEESMSFSSSQEDTEENVYHQKDVLISSSQSTSGYESLVLEDGLLSSSQAISECDSFVGQDVHRIKIKENKVDVTLITSPETNTEQSCTEEDKIILPLEQGHRIRKRKINTARNFFVKKCSKRMKVLCTSKMSMRRKRQSMLKEKDINKYPMQKTRTNSFEDEISVETTNQPEHQANNLIGNDIPIVTSTEKLIVEDTDTVNNLDEEDSMSISSTGATIGEQSISLDDYENLKDDIPITSALLLNDESDLISFKEEVLPTSFEKRIVEDSENSLDEDSMSISSTGATIGEQSFSLDDRDENFIKDDIPITSALVTSRSENEEIMPLNIKNLKLFDDNDKDFSTSTVRELKTDSTRDNIPEEKESISESTGKRKSGRFRKQPAQRTQLADEESEENMQSRKNKLEIFDDEKVSTKRLKSSTVTELKTDLTNGDNNMEKQTYSKFNVHTITKKLKAGRPRKKTDQRTQLTNEESEENRSSTKRKFEKVNDEEVLTKRINSSTVKKLEANFNKEKFSIPVPTDNTKPNKRRQGRPKKGVKPVEEYFIENNLVTCAVCKVKLNNKSWPLHKVKHYYLCWREGETEIDLNDRQEITTHLTRYLKEKKGMLVCAKCGDRKKSVIGYFSHQDQCEKTKQELLDMRVPCPICNNLMLPVSIKPHMDQIHRTIPVVQEENIPLELDIGRNKREAAIKAFDLIKEVAAKEQPKVTETEERIMYKKVNNKTKAYLNKCFWMDYALKNHKTHSCTYNDCEFVTNNLEEFKSHVSKCPELKTNDFICTYCIFTTSEESDMEKHIKENHALVDISDDESNSYQFSDDSDLEATSETSSPKKKTQTAPFIFQKPDFLTQDKKLNTSVVCAYPTTMKWTKELYECNFSEELFKDFKINKSSDWLPLTSEEQLKYYPDLKESMSVKHINLTNQVPKLQSMVHEWKNYKLYEATIENGTATLFCGGPIWALAWTPTPLNKIEDQILAVSIQKDVNKLFKISKCYRSEEVIQFWNFGAITNENKMTEPPKLEFNLIHNHGQVWCMEWCPSGCYQEPNPEISDDLGRLGLLALACSDGNIAIYSIPMFDKTKRNSDEILFYKPKEIYRLVSEQEIGFWDAQVTKLCWSKGKGHNVIAGGFSNGAVILWNLDNTSTVTKSVKDGVIILKPSTSFKPHSCAISALTLHPLDGGSRYLYTGSWDKTTKYWDLENIYTPISSFLKKGLITDGVWMSNWICSFTAYDDVFNYSHTVTTIQNARDCGFKQAAVLATNSLVNSISANDWANAIVQASVVGEITMSVQRQLLNTFDEKSVKNKRISLGYSELIDKTLTPTEREAKEIRIKKKKEFDKNKKEKSFHNKYYLERQNEQLYEEEPEDYQSAQEKYGLIFCDPDLNDYENIPPDLNKMLRKSNKMRETILDLYSLQSINRTAWNPNYQSHLYLAYGHQIGFARVNCVRFLNKPQEE